MEITNVKNVQNSARKISSRYKERCFRLLTKKKIVMRNRTSDPRTPRSEALPLSHKRSTEIKKDVFRLVTSVGQRKNSESP